MTTMQTKWWPAPTQGEAPDLPPDQLGLTQARTLRNLLVHNPGRVVPRGSIGGPGATEFGSLVDTTNGGTLLGTVVADDAIGVSYRAPSAGPLVDYWRVPINRPTVAGQLAQPSLGATAGRAVDLTTGAVTDVVIALALSVQGVSSCRVDNALYGATFGGVSTAIPTGVAPLNNVRKAILGGGNLPLVNGPRFVQAVFSHYGRVWAAGARQPGGADYDTSQVFYTIPGGTTGLTDVITDWQDPVTGELNRIAIGAGNDGDFVVGFGRAAGQMLVFKRNAIYILYGTAPSNFTLRQLRAQSGCVDLRSIVVADEGTYFASQLGYELFDGNKFTVLSNPVQDTWQDISNTGVAGSTVNHAYIRADPLPNGYIYLSLGTDGTAANSDDGTTRGWFLYRPTGAWIDVQTAISTLKLGAGGYFNRFVVTRGTVTAWGAAKWARADLAAYGVAEALGAVDRDTSSSFSVDLRWTTSLDNLGSYRNTDGRWQTATLKHATLDYKHRFTNSTPADLSSIGTLTVTDGFGDTLMAAQPVPGYRPAGPTRVRPMYDCNQESPRGDATLALVSNIGSSSSLRTAKLSIYGVGLAFMHGRERRHPISV